jgi:putative membrane protein
METASALALSPVGSAGVSTLAYAVAGILLGTASGLVPGLHVNSLALLVVAAAPSLPGSNGAVAAAALSAGIVHTFLDVVPALVLGVPEAATAPGALPGHRLVLAGRGREALRLSALGSALAAAVALPVAFPLSAVVAAHVDLLSAWLPVVLAVVLAALLAAEPTWRARAAGAACVTVAGAFGWVALDLSAAGPLAPDGGSILAPVFAGLFGAPVLVDSLSARGAIPPQRETATSLSWRRIARTALAGVGGGALVGYLPGVSAGVAAVIALGGAGGSGPTGGGDGPAGGGTDRAYVVATSGANTATAVFAVGSLALVGDPRSGVTVALASIGGGSSPLSLPTLAAVIVVAAGAATALVPVVGDRYLRLVRRAPRRPLSLGVLCLLAGLALGVAGFVGGAVFAIGTLVGLLPPRLGTRRVHLMAVLVVPVALG